MKRGYRRTSKQIYKGFFRLLFAAMVVMVLIGGIDDLSKGFISMKKIGWITLNSFAGDRYSAGQNISEMIYYRQSASSAANESTELTLVTLAVSFKQFDNGVSAVTTAVDDALIMIKSALIFSKDVHLRVIIFDDGGDVMTKMNEKLLEYSVTAKNLGLTFQYQFVKNFVPAANKKFDLASVLKETDAVIWLDPQNLFLSSLKDVWRIFESFNSNQLVGSSAKPFKFGSGMTLVNLTRIRTLESRKKVDTIFKKYDDNQPNFDDATTTVLETFLEENYEAILFEISCAFDYRKNYCQKQDGPCGDAEQNGIAVVNGKNGGFRDSLPLKIIHDHFWAFDLATGSPWLLLDRILTDLIYLEPTMEENPCLEGKKRDGGKKILQKFSHYLLTQLNRDFES